MEGTSNPFLHKEVLPDEQQRVVSLLRGGFSLDRNCVADVSATTAVVYRESLGMISWMETWIRPELGACGFLQIKSRLPF